METMGRSRTSKEACPVEVIVESKSRKSLQCLSIDSQKGKM
jgi:hypothetical protein